MADPIVSNGESQPVHANHSPVALHANGMTTLVYQGPDTKAWAVQVDPSTGDITGPFKVSDLDADGATDDHGAPCILRRSDGVFDVFHGPHNDPIGWAVSDSADDISSWTDQSAISTGAASNATYLFGKYVGSTAYLFFRDGSAGAAGEMPLFMMKIISGTPQTPVEIYDPGSNSWIYPADIWLVGDKLYIGFLTREGGHGDGSHRDPAILVIDTANNDAIESVFGDSLSTPVTVSELNTFARIENTGSASTPPNTAYSLRFGFDENDGIYALYSRWVSGSTFAYRFADGSNGASWSLSDIAPADGEASACELVVHSSTDIDAFFTRSDGTVDRWNGPSWTNAETLDTGSSITRFVRRVENAHADLRIFLFEEHNEDFANADLQAFAWGDSGFIAPTTLVDPLDGNVSSIPHRRAPITSNTARITGTHTDFKVVLVPESSNGAGDGIPWEALDLDGSNPAQVDGRDIRVSTDAAGDNLIPIDVVRWEPANDPSTAKARIVFEAPNWRSGRTDTYYLHWAFGDYDAPGRDADTGRHAVWDGLRRVYELDDAIASGIAVDRTGNDHGTLVNTAHLFQTDGGIDFDNDAGASEDTSGTAFGNILLPSIGALPTGALIAAVTPDNVSSGRIFAHSDFGNNARLYFGFVGGAMEYRLGGSSGQSAGSFSADTFTAMGLRWANGTAYPYKDGGALATSSYSNTPGSDNNESRIGVYGTPAEDNISSPYDGEIFNLWLFDGDPGEDAIATYTGMLESPVGFVVFGPPEDAGAISDPDTITVTDVADRSIIQRDGSDEGSILVSGSYGGTPDYIQYRIVAHGTAVPVAGHDWTTGDASPADGTFSFLVSGIPAGGWYAVEVRSRDGAGEVLASDTGTSRFGVGALIGVIGSVNAAALFSVGSAVQAHDQVVKYTDAGWSAAIGGDGAVRLGNALQAALGMPVGLLAYGVANSGLRPTLAASSYWLDPAADEPLDRFLDGALSVTSDPIEALIWIGGETDVQVSVSENQYLGIGTADGGLEDLIAEIRSDLVGRGGGRLPVVISSIGRGAGAGDDDSDFQAIRRACMRYEAADDACTLTTHYDLALGDTISPSAAAMQTLGLRLAAAVLGATGAITVDHGPRIVAISGTPGEDTVTLAFDQALADPGAAYSTEGWLVAENGAPIAVASVTRISSRKLALTLAAAVDDLTAARIAIAWGAGSSSAALTYPTSAAIALPNGAGTVNWPAEPADFTVAGEIS